MKQLHLANLAATAFSRDVGTGRRDDASHIYFSQVVNALFFGMRLRRDDFKETVHAYAQLC